MLIDFGDTGPSVVAIDPVTLELSTIFHTQRSMLPLDWPTEENMKEWFDVDRFIQGCSFGLFIKACREWALAEAASAEEVVAVAYGYAVRQLKYGDTDKVRARALIRACIDRLKARYCPCLGVKVFVEGLTPAIRFSCSCVPRTRRHA